MNDLVEYSASAEIAVAQPKGKNYEIHCGNGVTTLKRDIDFGVVPGTRTPSLLKSGAEKVCFCFGLLQHYTVESAIEDPSVPIFFYRVRCDLVKVVNGKEYVFSSGYGSANTNEKRNGRNSAFDAANATLKMAEKRSLVSASLHISGLSDCFSQDTENESFMAKADTIVKETPESPISAAQKKRLFAIAGDCGLTQSEVKKVLAEQFSLSSTNQITQAIYNNVIDAIKAKGETHD